MPEVPAIVLSADKPYRTDLLPADIDRSGLVSFDEWVRSEQRLAAALHAPYVPKTDSGHNIYLYNPALVTASIRAIVDEVRAGDSTRS